MSLEGTAVHIAERLTSHWEMHEARNHTEREALSSRVYKPRLETIRVLVLADSFLLSFPAGFSCLSNAHIFVPGQTYSESDHMQQVPSPSATSRKPVSSSKPVLLPPSSKSLVLNTVSVTPQHDPTRYILLVSMCRWGKECFRCLPEVTDHVSCWEVL